MSDWHWIGAHDVNMMSFWCQFLCSESWNNSLHWLLVSWLITEWVSVFRHQKDIILTSCASIWCQSYVHDLNMMSFRSFIRSYSSFSVVTPVTALHVCGMFAACSQHVCGMFSALPSQLLSYVAMLWLFGLTLPFPRNET